MSRTITLSTTVFAAIWANRRGGEETEDAILRRLLDCGGGAQANGVHGEREGGVYDARNDVHFPEGFEIFRNYKRREYKATTRRGVWVREDTGERFSTLNRLNESIARVTRTCGTEAGSTARPTERSDPLIRCAGRMEQTMRSSFGCKIYPGCGRHHFGRGQRLHSSQAN